MANFKGSIYSDQLGMRTNITVSLPFDVANKVGVTTPPEDMPILYLLHGLSDDNTMWSRYTDIERFADYRGFIVVMPEVQRSFYSDMVYGPNYFSYIADELPALVKSLFGIERPRERTFVAGLSMGGYGAAKVALSRPDRYMAAASFSGVLDVRRAYDLVADDEFYAISKGVVRPQDDLFALAEKTAAAKNKPSFFITCGIDDVLVSIHEQQDDFKKCLDKYGYKYEYREWPGGHEWRLWEKSVEQALDYFMTLM